MTHFNELLFTTHRQGKELKLTSNSKYMGDLYDFFSQNNIFIY